MLRASRVLWVANPSLQSRRWLASSGSVVEDHLEKQAQEERRELEKGGNRVLYRVPQTVAIRTMLGVSCVNLFFWGSEVASTYLFKGVMFNGVDLGGSGDPYWSYVGCCMTIGLVWFVRYFSHRTVYAAYENPETQRIGLQMHTVLGFPGRKVEVPYGGIKFLSPKQGEQQAEEYDATVAWQVANPSLPISQMPKFKKSTGAFGSSYVPTRVEGIDGNVLLENSGLQTPDGRRLTGLLLSDTTIHNTTKEQRKKWWSENKTRRK